jgi:hypothetical protein
MARRFTRHYSREEAQALLPQIRIWLERLYQLRQEMDKMDTRLAGMLAPGADLGGTLVNRWIRTAAEMKDVLLEFYRRQIQIKDIDRGLVDFPALIGGKEVFLCWEKGEESVEFWHDLDAGFAGREPLEEE